MTQTLTLEQAHTHFLKSLSEKNRSGQAQLPALWNPSV